MAHLLDVFSIGQIWNQMGWPYVNKVEVPVAKRIYTRKAYVDKPY